MKHRRLLSILLALVMVLVLLPAVTAPAEAADDVHLSGTSGGCKWSLDSDADYAYGKGMVLKVWADGNGVMGDDLSYSFYNFAPRINEVRILDGVTHVGNNFLWYNDEQSRYYSLQIVRIPDSVTSVGDHAFHISWYSTCHPELYGGENIESMGQSAFFGIDFIYNDLCFPNITTAEDHTFDGMKARSLTLPNLETIEYHGLYGCSVPVVNLGTKLRTIGRGGLYSAVGLEKLYLPATLESIGGFATYGCHTLTDVYYAGSQAQWEAIDIDNEPMWGSGSETSNHWLLNATIHYNYELTIADGTATIPSKGTTDQVLSVTISGTAAGVPSSALRYQWQRTVGGTWTDISGETGSTYTVTSTDYNRNVRVRITAQGYTGTLTSNSCYCLDGVPLTAAYFPDSDFRQYLSEEWDRNSDGYLTWWEISLQNEIHIGGTNVASLSGIEYLEPAYIYAYRTKITSFDGTGNNNLYVLDLSDCNIDSLNVTNNWNLTELYLSGSHGSLRNPDFSNNSRLSVLETYDSSVSVMDISYCPYLVNAALYGEKINASNSRTYKLSNRNYLKTDGYDYNVTIAYFDEVFPDARFRSIIQNNSNINWDSDDNLNLSEARDVTSLFVEDEEEDLTSLAGIQYFPNLDYLSAFNNRIGYIDLSRNTKLTSVDLGANLELETLDVSMLKELESLYVQRNSLTELTLGNLPKLTDITAWDNDLGEVDVSGCPALTDLDLDMNLIGEIDLSHNPELKKVWLSNNLIDELDVSNNPKLTVLTCYGSFINTLDISNNPNLISAYCGTREERTDSDTGIEFYRYSDGTNTLCVDKVTEVDTGSAIPVIGGQPTDVTAAAGTTVSFSVTAAGATGYQWQYSDDGTTWKNCSSTGYNNATFSFKASVALHNRQYRCVVMNGTVGSIASSAAKLTVVGIKTQPTNQTVAVGAQATFKVVATGATSYQWQWSADGTTWKNCTSSGYNTDTFSFKASTALNGRQYRCRITNGSITVTSNAGKLTVTTAAKPTITTQPTNQSVTAGSKATFKVVASGATSYQWQWSANGTTWTDCKSTGYNTNTFAFTASASLNGRQYRCIVKNSAGSVTSSAAKLTVTSAVTKPTITTQPTDKTVTSGTSVTFKVVATGTGLTYQWQWSGDNGKTWKNCTSTGYNTASFSFKASAALNGRMYRCVVKNSAGSATSTGAKLTVSNVKPAITVQPTNKNATAGTKVSFSVIAAGSGLKYQWQYSDNGTTWTNCKSTGYNTATFTFTASASLNNRQYRCVVSNSYGSTTSSAGKLTVK